MADYQPTSISSNQDNRIVFTNFIVLKLFNRFLLEVFILESELFSFTSVTKIVTLISKHIGGGGSNIRERAVNPTYIFVCTRGKF